jgi:Ser/Thr protein kinase RdoA (MazF antagonist)
VDLTAYGLVVDRARPVPGGYTADCYRVTCGADDYLVKVWQRCSSRRTRILGLLGQLKDDGLPVVPPIETCAGTLTATTDAGEVAVFPFVDGTVPPDWPAWPDGVLGRLGAVLADIHRIDVSSVASLPWDRLGPFGAWPVASYPPLDRYAGEVDAQLRRLASIRPGPFRPVLCHTDFAGDNLLVTGHGIVVLDWDEAVIGPAEVDVMLFVTPDGRPVARMLDGYRAAGGDVSALSLRRLEFCLLRRYLGDAAVRVDRIADPSATDSTRAAAFADFEMWGVRMWRRLDAGLEAVAPMLDP